MNQLQQIFEQADQLYSLDDIDQALNQLAAALETEFADKNPLLLCVMNGSVVTIGHLLPKLSFLFELDYIHLSRYGDKVTGGQLNWLHKPSTAMPRRDVILIEDIFDEGITLQALREYCYSQQAQSVSCVALINKLHDNKTGIPPEFIGLTVPDRYIFGFGMDYQGYWRNAPGIYAVKGK